MEALLVAIGEVFIEFVVQVSVYAPFDRPASKARLFSTNFALLILGGILGALSLLVFRSTILEWPVLRIANLVVAPTAAGFLFRALAQRRARTSFNVVPRLHFWHAFWFTLGWVVVRFVFAGRA